MMTQPNQPQTSRPFNGDNIPATLKANQRWAPWRAVWNDKRQKFDKIPAHAKAPYYGISTARPERWYTYAVALKAYQDNPALFAGVGYVMTGQHDVVGVDLDNCVDDNTIAPWAQEVIDRLASYTELSPSGKGLRIMVVGSIPNDWTNHERGIEVYGGHEPRFLTVTGQRLKVSVPDVRAPAAGALDMLSSQYAKTKTTATIISLELPDILDEMVLPSLDSLPLPTSVSLFLTTGDHGGDRSRALFAASVALYSAGLGDDEVFSLLALNPWAFEVALDHRRQDNDRALMYLWVEHCQKGKAKSTPAASLADFENLTVDAGPTPVADTPKTDEFEVTGSADDFDIIEENQPLAPADIAPSAINNAALKPKFYAEPAGEFAEGAIPPWMIKGLIPQAELGMLFGESGSGKSFVALDLACAVARGLPWRGNKVKQGKVVYVCAEGAGGFRKRLRAYALTNEIKVASLNDSLRVISSAPNLMVKDDALAVAKSIRACGKVVLVIVDTLAQVMPGANENTGEDVGKVFQHCKGIHIATGAMVLLVHHSGKDASKGARGWSGMKGAMDVELEVTKGTDGVRVLRDSKQKDEEDGREWGFTLLKVPIGTDEDGDTITSCAVREAAIPVPKPGGAGANKNTGKWAARVLEVLGGLAMVQTTGIERKAVLDMVVSRSPDDGNDPTGRLRRQQASRALKGLLEDEDGQYMPEDDGTISVIV